MVQVRGHFRNGAWVSPHTRRGGAAGGGVLLGAVAVVLWWNAGHPSLLPTQHSKGATTGASVTRIVDGDTVIARDAQGQDLGRVRILGMDAPELARDGRPAMCGAADAKEELGRRLDDHDITLVSDPNQPDRDTYGRLLRYVEVGSTDVTEALIRSGHAPNSSREPGHIRHDTYVAAENDAREHQRGLWSACQ